LRTTAIFVGTSVVSSTSYVFSPRLTSVANVMTVYAALPFIATGIGYIWIGEPVTRRFLLAGTIAAGGIAGMAGGSGAGRSCGIAAALVMTAGFAIQLVAIRRHPGVDVLALNACSAAACVPVVLPFASWAVPGAVSLGAAALYGVLTTGLAYVLAMEGGRRVSQGGRVHFHARRRARPLVGVACFFGTAGDGGPPRRGGRAGAVGWYLGTLQGGGRSKASRNGRPRGCGGLCGRLIRERLHFGQGILRHGRAVRALRHDVASVRFVAFLPAGAR
jgi:hypothetical protein